MSNLYFAYGSNMSRARLQERVPAAEPMGPAFMTDWRLACNKRGVDGTGKANLIAASGFRAWGVLYRLLEADWATLDDYEPGYIRSIVEVNAYQNHTLIHRSVLQSAQIYLATQTGPEVAPAPWYREHLLVGAREHDLPSEIILQIEQLGDA